MENEKARILIVDDTPKNIQVLGTILKIKNYQINVAQNGLQALEVVQKIRPDLILLDVMMPELDGFETCKRLKASEDTRDIPVIFLTAKVEQEDIINGFKLGAVDYVTKPFNQTELLARVDTHIQLQKAREELQNQNEILEQKVRERTQEIRETQKETLVRLTNASELRDTDTGMHIRRIQGYSELLALESGMSAQDSDDLGLASTMHDLGKIGIPDSILLKPGKLSDDEWKIMKTHPEVGAKILTGSTSKLLEQGRVIALHHHEKWDGTGYPSGLAGEDISLAGRIVGIIDVFDALTTNRPYKKAWSIEQAAETMAEGKGKHFDPQLIELFINNLSDFLAIRQALTDEENSAIDAGLT